MLRPFPNVAITTSYTEKVVLLNSPRAVVNRAGSPQWKWQKDMLVMIIRDRVRDFCCIKTRDQAAGNIVDRLTELARTQQTGIQIKGFCDVWPTVAWESSELWEPRLLSITQTPPDPLTLGSEDVAWATKEMRSCWHLLWSCGMKMLNIEFSAPQS